MTGMEVDVKIAWTPSDWRRFLGLADITPLVELMSVVADGLAFGEVERRLEALSCERAADDGEDTPPIAGKS